MSTESLTLSDATGLFAALRDPEEAVRIAAARALTRLPLDFEASAEFRPFRAEIENRHLNWSTFLPEPELLDRIQNLVDWPAEQEFNAAAEVVANTLDPVCEVFAKVALYESLDEFNSEPLAQMAQQQGPAYFPDIQSFFRLYEFFLRRAAGFWFHWVNDQRDHYDPTTALPSWFPLREGALAASRQLEWILSRHGMKPLLDALNPVLKDGSSRRRFAAAQLIEWARRTESMSDYWRFGGGSAPADVLSKSPDLIWKYTGGRPLAHAAAPSFAPSAAAPVPTPAPPREEERAINFWLREREDNPELALNAGQTYTASCSVGKPVASNLFTGPAVPDSDVPPGGLATRWTLVPENVTLTPLDPRIVVAPSGVIEFDLLIPCTGDSEIISTNLTPTAKNAGVTLVIRVGQSIYRECRITLDSATKVVADIPAIALRHAALQTTHEWTTPPGTVNLFVLMPGKALISGSSRGAPFPPGEMVDLETAPPILTNPVDQVRTAAEAFRAKWSSYLNDIDPADLVKRLAGNLPQYDWDSFDDLSDSAHAASWQSAATSPELWNLAFYGKKLYDTLFPKGSKLRLWLDGLPAGQRVNVVWRPDSGAGFAAYIPWELLYRADVTKGLPVDATQFWGLSYRLEYTASRPPDCHSASLGAPLEACCTSVLFFGNSAKEPASAESQWQRQVWNTLAAAGNTCAVPGSGAATPKIEIERALAEPESVLPSGKGTVAVLYLYCHYDSSTGAPILRFGLDSSNPDDVLQETELSTGPLVSYPLVFANACSTAGAGVFAANYLTRHFFDRGARAFIGSHCKVPPVLASRFAMIFFHFLLRLEDQQKKPMAAGEAMSQSRIFLWRHYKNIGGLLYSYLNQYDLYLASESELRTLVSH